MSIRFEKVSRFANTDLPMPTRGTADSAGYDFVVAEDIVIPPYDFLATKIRDKVDESKRHSDYFGFIKPFSLDEVAKLTKENKVKPSLVSTGMKCYMEPGQYLELSLRSSTPLKHWLVLANGVGVIDRDYADCADTEGEIFFQLINFFPFAIELKRGNKIGQGIIKNYKITDNDCANGERVGGLGSTSESNSAQEVIA